MDGKEKKACETRGGKRVVFSAVKGGVEREDEGKPERRREVCGRQVVGSPSRGQSGPQEPLSTRAGAPNSKLADLRE